MTPAIAAALILSTDAVFLRHDAVVDLVSDSTAFATESSVEVIIPLDAAGVSRYSTLSIPFDASTESVEVERAEMHPVRPGRMSLSAVVSERPLSGLADNGRLESNFREYVISFQGVETGDTLFISTRRHVIRLPLVDAYSYSFYFQAADSIASSSFTVLSPDGMGILTAGPPPGDVREVPASGTRRMVWTSGPTEPLPRLPLGVPVEQEARHVTIASHTPSELGSLLYGILDPGPGDGQEIEALRDVIESVGRSPDTLRAWVASSISYLGSRIGTDPGFTPRSPLSTLQERCGVCRDKSVLLTALLRVAGHDAWLGLTRMSHPLDSLCGIRDFDHMVVLLADGGEVRILDPSTAAHASPFSSAMRGLPVLPAAPWCEGYETVPFLREDTVSICLSLGFTAGMDSLEGSLRAEFSGAVDELWRDMLTRIETERWPEMLEALFGVSPSSSLQVSGDPLDPLSELSVAGNVSLPVLMAGGEEYAFILPGLAEIDVAGSRLAALLLSQGGQDRPGGPDTPLLEMLEGSIRIPGGFEMETSQPLSSIGFSSSVRLEGDSLRWSEFCDLGNLPSAELQERALLRSSSSSRRVVLWRAP